MRTAKVQISLHIGTVFGKSLIASSIMGYYIAWCSFVYKHQAFVLDVYKQMNSKCQQTTNNNHPHHLP